MDLMQTLLARSAAKLEVIPAEAALPGRAEALRLEIPHFVFGNPLMGPYPDPHRRLVVGMGCFWGAERRFWTLEGVVSTAVGYGGGHTPNPTYKETCSGRTGHTEVVQVIWDPTKLSLDEILRRFWEGHDPTQGMRQGNDVGTQYRSAIFCDDEATLAETRASRDRYQAALDSAGKGAITTEIEMGRPFYFAERDHQQYLAKNPNGYCGLGGTGVACPIGTGISAAGEQV